MCELDVTHETFYGYGGMVEIGQHLAYLRPLTLNRQKVLSYQLTIEPEPSHIAISTDAFGNERTFFAFYAPHDELTVTATSRVELLGDPVIDEKASPAHEHLHDMLRYRADTPFVPEAEFTFPSPMVPLHREIRDYGRESFTPDRPMAEAAIDLMHRIHRDFAYETASTDVSTPLIEAFRGRHGVCQDFAHVLIGAMRAMGFAARYVSGYLMTTPPEGQARLIGADASHAWADVWCPINGWIGLDPTNDCMAGPSHVVLAIGRDYGDVAPVRGVIRGAGAHTLSVAVTVDPLDEEAAES